MTLPELHHYNRKHCLPEALHLGRVSQITETVPQSAWKLLTHLTAE